MQSVTLQSPVAADGKHTGEQSPFICLRAEIRNKIYRYSIVEGPSGARIHGFAQPPLTRVNCQIRSEALPIYYGQNKFLLSIPQFPAKSDPKAWPNFVSMFMAFRAGRAGGRGTGSLQYIRDLKCEIRLSSGNCFRLPGVCFTAVKRPRTGTDTVICGERWIYDVVFEQNGSARVWQDWDSVDRFVGRHMDRLGATEGPCMRRLVSTVVMVAKECPGVTEEIHFHSDVGVGCERISYVSSETGPW